MEDLPADSKQFRLTYPKMFQRLDEFGIHHEASRCRWHHKGELPSRALVSVKASLTDTKDWHWMVFHRGVFYDPMASRPLNWVRRAPCFLIKLH